LWRAREQTRINDKTFIASAVVTQSAKRRFLA
jgi:hypothetical protein